MSPLYMENAICSTGCSLFHFRHLLKIFGSNGKMLSYGFYLRKGGRGIIYAILYFDGGLYNDCKFFVTL